MATSEWNSLVDVARDRAEHHPTDRVITFLKGDTDEDTLSLAEVDERARELAATIQARELGGERVLLLFPPGLDYVIGFWACLYAKAVAVPAYPPDPKQLDRTLPRLAGIIRDSGAKAILTTQAIRLLAQPILKLRLGLTGLAWLTTKRTGEAADWVPPHFSRDDLAFLQYTSGSTGEPKGVMVSHGNLLENAALIADALALNPQKTGLLWLPPYHDMGLMAGVVQPVVSHMNLFLMSPLDFISRPVRWLNMISRHRIWGSGGPNFAYDLCIRRIGAKEKASLDLSSWQLAFTGAEPIRSGTLRRFAEEFASCGFRPESFYPCYGLAEATLFVSGSDLTAAPTVRTFDRDRLARGEAADARSLSSVEIVGVGRPGRSLEMRIVDPETSTPCADDRVGEIWVAGPSMGQGYWGREEESEQTFRARLSGQGEGAQGFMRTGDLGFVSGGELFIAGRIKDTVIVNGANYYPQDIEAVVDHAHDAIRAGRTAAFGVDRPEGEVLGTVSETRTDRREELEEAAAAIRQKVTRAVGIAPEVIAFIPRRTLLMTSSGKVRRRAVRDALLDKSLPTYVVFDRWPSGGAEEPGRAAERAEAAAALERAALVRLRPEEREQRLVAMVAEAVREVHHDAPAAPAPDTRVADLGLDSVQVVELLAAMEEQLGVVLPMERLAHGVTIRELVAAISEELDRDTPASAASAS
jgi:acyl-CoA synthetase (AMP-forming)/AMP-acid ligase II/acyl carrier protein